jgi:hypothetical protein
VFFIIQRWYSDAKFDVDSDFAINHILKWRIDCVKRD